MSEVLVPARATSRSKARMPRSSASLSRQPLTVYEQLNMQGGNEAPKFHLKMKSPSQRSWLSPFASLSLRGDAALRRTFKEIDAGSKGYVTEEDLRCYALDNGLPPSYVAPFVSAVLNAPGSKKSSTLSMGACERNVYYDSFKCFVRSRESALQRAFSLFDKDGDGKISVDDLDLSLTHVVIECPKSRCVYKTSNCKLCPKAIQSMLGCASVNGQSQSVMAPITLKAASKATSRKVKSLRAERSKKEEDQKRLDINFNQFREFFFLLPQANMVIEYWLSAGCCPDLDARVQFHEDQDSTKGKSPWGHLLSGAMAGAASRTATAPLETLRLGIMSGSLEAGSLLQQANQVITRGGSWKALYRGNLVNVMRSAPQKALDFLIFDVMKQALGETTHMKTFAAAGLAGAASWSFLYPLEVVRSRITSGIVTSNNIPKVLSTIVKAEGVGALYKGLGWSVAGIIPEAAITYGLHDVLKLTYKKTRGEEPSVPISLSFGILAAFTGQTVAFPLESISRRMQVGQSLPQVLKECARQGGLKALYRGIGAATLRLFPMACVSFGVYELMRAKLVELEEWQTKKEAEKQLQKRLGCELELAAL